MRNYGRNRYMVKFFGAVSPTSQFSVTFQILADKEKAMTEKKEEEREIEMQKGGIYSLSVVSLEGAPKHKLFSKSFPFKKEK